MTLGRRLEAVGRVLNAVGAVAIFFMMVVSALDVILRYGFRQPIPGATDLASYLMVTVVFLGLAHTQAKRGHVRIEIFVSRLPPLSKSFATILALLFILGISSIITWQSWAVAWNAWKVGQYSHGIPHFPLYPSKLMVPVGSFALCLQVIVDIANEVLRVLSPRQRQEVSRM